MDNKIYSIDTYREMYLYFNLIKLFFSFQDKYILDVKVVEDTNFNITIFSFSSIIFSHTLPSFFKKNDIPTPRTLFSSIGASVLKKMEEEEVEEDVKGYFQKTIELAIDHIMLRI